MNNLKWAIATGATVLSFHALPAQAASVFSTTSNIGGAVRPAAAYRIEGLTVGSTTYDVDFEHGEFSTIFSAPPQYFSNADEVGEAIVQALRAPTSLFVDGAIEASVPITTVIDQLNSIPTFGEDVVTQFHIPLNPVGINGNNGEHLLSVCNVNGLLTTACQNEDRNLNGPLMYAKFSAVAAPPTGGGSTAAIPTPALLPGLLGMGAAMVRRKKQAAEVMDA